jgi:hypothetical protein
MMEKFQFPDEAKADKPAEDKVEFEIEGDAAPEIEVVDDTPEVDRGRTPMKEPPAEVTDEELAQYNESVKKRIQHFSKGYHDERRAKEAALREREEALRIAQTLAEENKKLQGSLGKGQQALIEQAKQVVSSEVEQARRKLKEAHEAFDTEGIIAAQEELTAAKIKAERINNYQPAPLQEEKAVVQPEPQQAQAPTLDPKTRAWTEKNSWFGPNRKMTAFALALHQDLVDSGVQPATDNYFSVIDAEMRKTFPDAFPSEKVVQRSNVVAPATRSTAPKKIVLTQTQVSLAKRLGLPLEVYARQVAEEMRKQNG